MEIIWNILGEIAWVILAFTISWVWTFVSKTLPAKRLWQLHAPKDAVICASNSIVVNTGEYMKSATGLGQMRAIPLVVTALQKAYGKVDFSNNIYMSTEQIHSRLENDLVLLGSGKTNGMSKTLLRLLRDIQPLIEEDGGFIWRVASDSGWESSGAEVFRGETSGGQVVNDFGIILRAKNPFTNRKRGVVLLAGSHTYGTIAAAKFFTESISKHQRFRDRSKNFVALVSTEIINEHPAAITLLKIYQW